MTKVVLRGRTAEITSGLKLLRRTVRTDQGGVLFFQGPPGIGKSALLAEVINQAARMGFRCGVSKADQITDISPAAPLLLALRNGSGPLLTAADLGRLHDCAGAPLLLLDELTAALEREASSGPVLIAIDDAQWIDSASRLVLRSLPSRLAGLPVVLAFTSRSSSDGLTGDLVRHPFPEAPVEVVPLGPLEGDDILAMAQDRLNRPPSEALRRLLGGAGGNPFFAAQIIDGVLKGADDEDGADIPVEFILSVRRRVAEAGAAAGDLVRVAAVFGKPLALEDIESLLSGVSRASVVHQLDQLAETGLLLTHSDGRIRFAHDMVREAVYADLTDRTRRALHQRCAEYLESAGDDSSTAAAHARAAIMPGDEDTARLLLRSAERLAGTMPEAAADLLLTAFHALRPEQPLWRTIGMRCVELLGLVKRCDEAVQVGELLRSRIDEADAKGQVDIVGARTLWSMNKWDAAVERSARGLRRPGLSETMRTRMAALHAMTRSRLEPAHVVAPDAERALAAAVRLPDQSATILARRALAEISRNQADHLASLRHFRELRALAGPTYIAQEIQGLQHLDRFADADVMLREARREIGPDRGVVFLSLVYSRFWADYHLGHLDDAEAGARTLLHLALECGSYLCGLESASLLSLVALQRGDVALARQRLTEGFGAAEADDERHAPSLLLVRGWITAAEGNPRQAADELRDLVFDARNDRDPWPWKPGWLRMLAHLGVSAEDAAFTDEIVALAEIAARRNPDVPSLAGTALHLRGLVDHDVEVLDEAVRALKASPRPLVQAGARQDLGFELVAQDRRHEGGQHLDAAWTTYRDIGANGPMTDLEDRMRRAGFRRKQWQAVAPRPTEGWSALTPAEAKVAGLIGAGYTNKAAGEELGVSANTVGTHLRSVFRKLDVHSRVQLSNLINQRGTDAGPVNGSGRKPEAL